MQTTIIIVMIVLLIGIIRDFLRNRESADAFFQSTLTRLVISPQLDRAEATILTPQGVPHDEDEIMANIALVLKAVCAERQSLGMDRIPTKENPVIIQITHRSWNPVAECYVDHKYPTHPFGVISGN